MVNGGSIAYWLSSVLLLRLRESFFFLDSLGGHGGSLLFLPLGCLAMMGAARILPNQAALRR
jgi:hypothetical protein